MNFNRLIHEQDRAHYTRALRRRALPSWLAFQLKKLASVYLPAMRKCRNRKSPAKIVWEVVLLWVKHRCLPIHYFHYGLYRVSVLTSDLDNYVPETRFYYHILPRLNRYHILLDDKIIAEEIQRAYGILMPATIALRRFGRWLDAEHRPLTGLSQFQSALRPYGAQGIVVKPAVLSSGGESIRVVRGDEQGRWIDQDGEVDLTALYAEPAPDLIIQQRERNGGSVAEMGGTVLECFRVLTLVTEYSPEVLYITLKLAGADAVVDNGHAGGIYVSVDRETGWLGRIGYDERGDEYSHHPVTGIEFSTKRIVEIRDIVACAEQAADAFRYMPIVGWDIALTDRGPLVIEGNSSPGLALMQRPHHGLPLLVERLRALKLS